MIADRERNPLAVAAAARAVAAAAQLTFVLTLGQAFAGAAHAQESSEAATSPSDSSFAQLQARINSQRRIRVLGAWGVAELHNPKLEVLGITYGAPALALDDAGHGIPERTLPQPLPLSDVTRIQVRGSAAGTGALIGAAVGAALGLAAGLGCASDEFFNCGGGEVVAATVVLGAGGAALGALVGAPAKKWKTVYRGR